MSREVVIVNINDEVIVTLTPLGRIKYREFYIHSPVLAQVTDEGKISVSL